MAKILKAIPKHMDQFQSYLGMGNSSHPSAPKNSEPAFCPLWKRHLVAVFLVAAAAGIRVGLLSTLGVHVPYVTFYPAVMLAALYGGLQAGLVASVSAVLLVAYWRPPLGEPLFQAQTADWVAMAA